MLNLSKAASQTNESARSIVSTCVEKAIKIVHDKNEEKRLRDKSINDLVRRFQKCFALSSIAKDDFSEHYRCFGRLEPEPIPTMHDSWSHSLTPIEKVQVQVKKPEPDEVSQPKPSSKSKKSRRQKTKAESTPTKVSTPNEEKKLVEVAEGKDPAVDTQANNAKQKVQKPKSSAPKKPKSEDKKSLFQTAPAPTQGITEADLKSSTGKPPSQQKKTQSYPLAECSVTELKKPKMAKMQAIKIKCTSSSRQTHDKSSTVPNVKVSKKEKDGKRSQKKTAAGRQVFEHTKKIFVVNSVPIQPSLSSTMHLAAGVSLKTKDSNSVITGPRKQTNEPQRLNRTQYNKYVENIKHTVQHQAKPLSKTTQSVKVNHSNKAASKPPQKKEKAPVQHQKENTPPNPVIVKNKHNTLKAKIKSPVAMRDKSMIAANQDVYLHETTGSNIRSPKSSLLATLPNSGDKKKLLNGHSKVEKSKLGRTLFGLN